MTGEGSDETLAGYTRYAFTLKNAAFDRAYRGIGSSVIRRGVRDSIASSPWIGATTRRKLSHTFLAIDGKSWTSFYFDNFFSACKQHEQADLLTERACEPIQLQARRLSLTCSRTGNIPRGDLLQRLLYTDIKTYLVELLMKQDNMSMAASIESRVPFLDHVLVEWAMRVPATIQIRGTAGKRILKKAMEDLLPHSIIVSPQAGLSHALERLACWPSTGNHRAHCFWSPAA